MEGGTQKVKSTYISKNLRTGLKEKQIDAIFEHEEWPFTPFIEIAEKLKLTKKSKLQHNDTFRLQQINKKVTAAEEKVQKKDAKHENQIAQKNQG